MPILFPGTSHPQLACAFSQRAKLKLGQCEIKKFSCRETYVKLNEEVRGEHCFILQTITSQVNDDLMEIFLFADALRRNGASSITLIIPHFGYSRQDRVAEKGEPISSKVIADLIVASGVSRVLTFDLHSDQIEGFFAVPVEHLKCYSLFADYFQKKKLKEPVIVAPDAGAAKIARRLADLLKAPMAILHKQRAGHHQVEHTHIIGDIKNKTAILFDDMIDTAGTICAAKKVVTNCGAYPDVYTAATHAILSGPACERLEEAGFKEIVVTDTVPLAKELKNIKVLSVVKLFITPLLSLH
jgi:ribose-phosphate pyrophosphokinase